MQCEHCSPNADCATCVYLARAEEEAEAFSELLRGRAEGRPEQDVRVELARARRGYLGEE